MKLDVQLNIGTVCLRGNLRSHDAFPLGRSLLPLLPPSLKHFVMTGLSHSRHHVDEEPAEMETDRVTSAPGELGGTEAVCVCTLLCVQVHVGGWVHLCVEPCGIQVTFPIFPWVLSTLIF